MRRRVGIVSIVVAVVAASCGGGEPPEEPPVTPAAAQDIPVAPPSTGSSTTVVAASGSAEAGTTTQSPDAEPASDAGLPNDLIAPGAVFIGEASSGIKFFTSTASFDDTVSHYEGVLGEGPVNVSGTAGERVASFLAQTPFDVLVQVEEGDGELLIYITLTG